MAYDLDLAERLRAVLAGDPDLSEKAMFGGLAFLIGGHLAVAASRGGGLMVRVDPADAEALVGTGAATRMVMRGREMDGWLRVPMDADAPDTDLGAWVERGVAAARALPPA